MKILIVDDSRSDRLSIKRSLRRHSAIELEFEEESVGEKIFQYDLSLFDGLIFDFHLRETTGLDLLKKLRAKSDLLPCPVVVVTGSASEDMGARCLEAGAHDYIDKDRL